MAWPRSTTSPSDRDPSRRLTVDELARAAGTTTRQVRALQTQGLLPRPDLVGRTGFYGAVHLDRLRAVLRLQAGGFSLGSLATLLRAWEAGMTLGQVLGLSPEPHTGTDDDGDVFGDLAGAAGWSPPRRGRLLSLVPSTILDQAAAS
ncbi:MAG TPA: MerR family transcriptional regulator [Acidimicrobiales bacterium]